MFFWKKKKKTTDQKRKIENNNEIVIHHRSIKQMINLVKDHFQNSSDLVFKQFKDNQLLLTYISEITDEDKIAQSILAPIQNIDKKHLTNQVLSENISLSQIKTTNDFSEVLNLLTRGWVFLFISGNNEGILINVSQVKERSLSKPENETHVYGPQIAFSESLNTNMSLIRQNINNPMLRIEDLMVGKVSKTKIALFYIEGITNDDNVNTVRQRIRDLEYDGIMNSSILVQFIDDNSYSIFPQLMQTERPDRLSHELAQGKVGVIVEGSTYAIVGPNTISTFFQSSEDYYVHWTMATFIRLIRFVATIMSIYFTPLYVMAITFHYEIIPTDLLVQLGKTRSNVPFPPLLEALFLEFTIELLREAGARLPTKVGQTMGIVGGIVIGQAAVQAGFTSNILIIIVALSALGSFTAPNYMMGNAIRIIRFPIIVLSGLYGGLGVGLSIVFLMIHLLRLSSLGRPYLIPYYPFRFREFKDTLIRVPFPFLYKRPSYTETKDPGRFNYHRAIRKKDIDE